MQSNHNMETTILMTPMDVLPENIDDLIDSCDSNDDTGFVMPTDVWMKYLNSCSE